MSIYSFDRTTKDVLIRRLDGESVVEILHKGDKNWALLAPRADYRDEEYCRAVYLGQGCWEDIEFITEEKAMEIMAQWEHADQP